MDLSKDFQTYSEQNMRRRKRAIIYLAIALLLMTLSSVFCIFILSSSFFGSSAIIPDISIPALGEWGELSDAGNALGMTHFCFNLVVAGIARYWYLRQDKLTSLLTEALVLEDENEIAFKLLLNKRVS